MSIPNLDSLKELVNRDNSCIVRCRQKLQLLVLPVYFNNLSKGIIKALDDITIGYCQPLGGLVLGYENIQVVQGTGWLHSTNPYIHVHILATFYVFAPTKGVQIRGVVNEVSESCISFLAYGKYNVVFRISHMYALLKSTNEQQKQAGNYLKKLVYSKALREGVVCTLQIQEAIFRDFIPHLLGYPVTDNSSPPNPLVEEDLPSLAAATETITEGRTRRVHFSDEDSEGSYTKKDIQKSLLTEGKIISDVGSATFEHKRDNAEKSKNKNNSSHDDSITMDIKAELKFSPGGHSSDESSSNNATLSLSKDLNSDVFTRTRCGLDVKIKEEPLSDADEKLSRKKVKVKRAQYKKEVYISDTEKKVSFEVKDEIKVPRAKELLVKEPVAMPTNNLETKKRKLKVQEHSLHEEDLKPKKKKRKLLQSA